MGRIDKRINIADKLDRSIIKKSVSSAFIRVLALVFIAALSDIDIFDSKLLRCQS
jgi:hypothetical protein